MIGNDIVDLRHPAVQPGAQHPRFDARVFAPSERDALARAPVTRLRWRFWAAKEAAYKALKKCDAATVWSPARFVVTLAEADAPGAQSGATGERPAQRGVVTHGGTRLPVKIFEDEEYIHAIACMPGAPAPDMPDTCFDVAQLGDQQDARRAVRRLAIFAVAPLLGVAREQLRIESRARIPHLIVSGRRAPFSLSLSHHGRFVAFAGALGGVLAHPVPPSDRAKPLPEGLRTPSHPFDHPGPPSDRAGRLPEGFCAPGGAGR